MHARRQSSSSFHNISSIERVRVMFINISVAHCYSKFIFIDQTSFCVYTVHRTTYTQQHAIPGWTLIDLYLIYIHTATKGVCIKCNDCFNVKRGLQNVIALEYGGKACRKQRKQLQFTIEKTRERERKQLLWCSNQQFSSDQLPGDVKRTVWYIDSSSYKRMVRCQCFASRIIIIKYLYI